MSDPLGGIFFDSHCTSAQLGYTVPFMLANDGKYRTEDKLKLHKLNTIQTDLN